jgi:enoyl-CoA hydratase/carnithine racemase
MGFDEIIYEKANRVAVITLNRPARLNAWTGRMESELREAVLIPSATTTLARS